MKSRTPFDSTVWSASVRASPSSIMRPYWKPEQPPPWTNTRRPLPALFSSDSNSLIFDAAVSDTLIMSPSNPSQLPPIIAGAVPYLPLTPLPQAEVLAAAERRWQALSEVQPDLQSA